MKYKSKSFPWERKSILVEKWIGNYCFELANPIKEKRNNFVTSLINCRNKIFLMDFATFKYATLRVFSHRASELQREYIDFNCNIHKKCHRQHLHQCQCWRQKWNGFWTDPKRQGVRFRLRLLWTQRKFSATNVKIVKTQNFSFSSKSNKPLRSVQSLKLGALNIFCGKPILAFCSPRI